ncbi:hypothetical protein Barb6_01162 [Bacteroidales bacterium Barb6]|nr:hypothetical protein Barb6_01162 [Bacteroidales bacterium Barb6]
MEHFEGYTGVPVGGWQMADDLMFALLFILFASFALIFHFRFPLVVKMVKDTFQLKERASLFEMPVKGFADSEWLFRSFMTVQAFLLSAVAVFMTVRKQYHLPFGDVSDVLSFIGTVFLFFLLFYFFKQGLYTVIGRTFGEREHREVWKASCHAMTGLWGIVLYVPVMWLVFFDKSLVLPLQLFALLYVLYRLVLFFNTIRIFSIKRNDCLFLCLYFCAQEIIPLFLFIKGSISLFNYIETNSLWH